MLLSLVVIFTQSIQLSKIVCGNEYVAATCHWDMMRHGFRHMLKNQCPLSVKQRRLNLEQVCFDTFEPERFTRAM